MRLQPSLEIWFGFVSFVLYIDKCVKKMEWFPIAHYPPYFLIVPGFFRVWIKFFWEKLHGRCELNSVFPGEFFFGGCLLIDG